jgi:CDP-2,3-bis-(O-geranylgeranyl)-sn-glycerol synthase
MLYLIVQVVWLGLPGAVSRLSPPIATRLFPAFYHPLDLNKKYKGNRILGYQKTFRGIITGLIFAHLTFVLQNFLLLRSPESFLVSVQPNLTSLPTFYGVYLGLGALAGDIIKSFFKRRQGIKPGAPWPPFDQVSWILGMLVMQNIFLPVNFIFVVLTIIMGVLFHYTVKFITDLIAVR